MRFKLDENLPAEAAAAFVEAGHEAETAVAEGLAGDPDIRLLAHCREERRVLVTLDLDFANIRRHPPAENAGFVVLRLRLQSTPRIVGALSRLLAVLPASLGGQLCVVDETSIRLRD